MRSLSRVKNPKSGFSLVELLIVVSIVAVLSLTTITLISNFVKSTASLDARNSVNGVTHSLQTYLANSLTCTGSVVPVNAVTTGAARVPISFDIPGIGVLAKDTLNASFALMVVDIFVDSPQLAETNPLGMRMYVGTLKLTAAQDARNEQDGRGLSFRERAIGAISLVTNSTGQIIKCGMLPMSLENPPGEELLPEGGVPETYMNGGTNTTPPGPAPTCGSVEQCAVYDWFLRNGILDPIASADAWMAANANWTSIAGSYVGQMSAISQMNLLSSSYQSGLVQTGLNGANTIDNWVLSAVNNDPTGYSMLKTREGLELFASLFPDTPGGTTPSGTISTAATQDVLRDLLSQSPEVTMNSGLGIGVWTEALGLANQAAFISTYTTAAIGSAANLNANQTAGSVQAVRDYIVAHPNDAINIARGTGLWAANVPGGTNAVTSFIAGSIAATGSMQTSMDLARATDTWATNYTGGAQGVADFIQTNSAQALQIANGTVIADQVFGGQAVAQAIMTNPSASATIAVNLDTFQKNSGWSTTQMKDYVAANPATWQADLAAAVSTSSP